ncbi:MAG: dipeptidase [Planctomycetota bacterium]
MHKRTRERGAGPLAAILATASLALAQHAPPPTRPPTCPPPPAGYDAALWQRAWALHHDALVVDTHIDTTTRILDTGFDMGQRATTGHVDLPRLRDGGLDAVFYSIYVDSRFYGDEHALFGQAPASISDDWPRPKDPGPANGSARRALMMIDGLLRTAQRLPEQMAMCTTVDELKAAVAAGRHAALMGIEGGHAIEGDLGLLRLFHQLGVRYMTLTHTNHNEFADSCAPAEPRWGGLNKLGLKVVAEMNRLGMMVDISHVADRTFYDVLRATTAPAICSHSSMRALCEHPRNITDGMLKALAANGGVVMINYNCGFLDPDYANASGLQATRRIQEKSAREKFAAGSPELAAALKSLDERFPAAPRPKLGKLVEHLQHAIAVAGADHVGLGSDFDGVSCVPEGMDDATYLPRITYELLAAGRTEAELRLILGGNLLRVFAAVEQRAYALRGTPPQTNAGAADLEPIDR